MTMMRTGDIVGVAGQVRQVGPFLAGSWFVKPSNSIYIYTYILSAPGYLARFCLAEDEQMSCGRTFAAVMSHDPE